VKTNPLEQRWLVSHRWLRPKESPAISPGVRLSSGADDFGRRPSELCVLSRYVASFVEIQYDDMGHPSQPAVAPPAIEPNAL